MEEIRTFLELTSVNSIMYIILGVVAFRELCELFTWLFDFLGLENKWTKKRNTESKMLQNHEQKLSQVSTDIKAINDKINVLSQMMIDMQIRLIHQNVLNSKIEFLNPIDITMLKDNGIRWKRKLSMV